MNMRNLKVRWTIPRFLPPAEYTMWRVAVGQALFAVGVPLAWIARDILRGGESPVFTAALMIFGILLTLDFGMLKRGRIRANTAQAGILLGPILFFSILAIVPLPFGEAQPADTRALVDFSVMTLLVLSGLSQPVVQFARLHRAVAIVGALAAAASIVYAVSSAGRLEDFLSAGRFGSVSSHGSADSSSPLNVAKFAMVTLIAAWIWLRENYEFQIFPTLVFIAALASALPMFILARSRTNMIGLLLVMIFSSIISALRRLRSRRPTIRRPRFVLTRLKLAFVIVVTIGVVSMAGLVVPKLFSLVTLALNFFGSGAMSFLSGGTTSFDGSAADRLSYLKNALNTFSLWGHGYKSGFADDPFLEAFYDLGLLGGSLYALVAVIVPAKICLDLALRGGLPASVKFAVASYIGQVPFLFLSRTPYELNNWAFIVIFYMLAGRYWSSEWNRRPLSLERVGSNESGRREARVR